MGLHEYLKCPVCNGEDTFLPGEMERDYDQAWHVLVCTCGFTCRECFDFSHNEDENGKWLDANGKPTDDANDLKDKLAEIWLKEMDDPIGITGVVHELVINEIKRRQKCADLKE